MGFWDIFNKEESNNQFESRLHKKIADYLPNTDENEHILIACISGLMARVAYVDFHLHENEEAIIADSLKTWTKLTEVEIQAVKKIAIEEIKELAGLENHKYCHPLNDILNQDQRFELLEALFAVAASDGEVESKENEEIRIIAKGLLLEQKYFISARATVVEYLKTLKV